MVIHNNADPRPLACRPDMKWPNIAAALLSLFNCWHQNYSSILGPTHHMPCNRLYACIHTEETWINAEHNGVKNWELSTQLLRQARVVWRWSLLVSFSFLFLRWRETVIYLLDLYKFEILQTLENWIMSTWPIGNSQPIGQMTKHTLTVMRNK